MPLILHHLAPMHFALAGLLIAAVTLVLASVFNRPLGWSSGFEDVCSLAISLPYFRREALLRERPWRLPMLIGLACGGVLSAWLGGGWAPTWDLGMLDQRIHLTHPQKLLGMFVGGLFIGFGTRLGGGCTSGHGIFGISNLERASVLTAMAFFLGGILTTNLVYRVLLP